MPYCRTLPLVDGNPYREKTDAELYRDAFSCAVSYEQRAAEATQQSVAEAYQRLAWLIVELASRVVR